MTNDYVVYDLVGGVQTRRVRYGAYTSRRAHRRTTNRAYTGHAPAAQYNILKDFGLIKSGCCATLFATVYQLLTTDLIMFY